MNRTNIYKFTFTNVLSMKYDWSFFLVRLANKQKNRFYSELQTKRAHQIIFLKHETSAVTGVTHFHRHTHTNLVVFCNTWAQLWVLQTALNAWLKIIFFSPMYTCLLPRRQEVKNTRETWRPSHLGLCHTIGQTLSMRLLLSKITVITPVENYSKTNTIRPVKPTYRFQMYNLHRK